MTTPELIAKLRAEIEKHHGHDLTALRCDYYIARLETLINCLEALQNECCCLGGIDYTTKDIKCDACETLARASERLGVKT